MNYQKNGDESFQYLEVSDIQMIMGFSTAAQENNRQWNSSFQILKGNNFPK